jgi:capsular polysaccharide biosynthesis protein
VSRSGLIPLLRPWWWLILAAAAVSALLAWVFVSQEQKTYQADVKLLVGPVSADLPTVQASGALGRTYAELAHSRPVVKAAARSAHVKLTPQQVDSAVTATSNDVTRIVDVQVRYSDPAAATRLAAGVARQLQLLRTKPPDESGDSADAIMRDPEIIALPANVQRIVRNAVIGVVGSPDVGRLDVVDAPLAARGPVAPKVTLLVLLAALVGALLGSVYALIREGAAGTSSGESFDDFEVDTLFPSSTNGVAHEPEPDEEVGEVSKRELW